MHDMNNTTATRTVSLFATVHAPARMPRRSEMYTTTWHEIDGAWHLDGTDTSVSTLNDAALHARRFAFSAFHGIDATDLTVEEAATVPMHSYEHAV